MQVCLIFALSFSGKTRTNIAKSDKKTITKKKKSMKKYFAVATTITDRGVSCNLIATEEAVIKPQSTFRTTSRADYYVDWFDSEEDAQRFIDNQKML